MPKRKPIQTVAADDSPKVTHGFLVRTKEPSPDGTVRTVSITLFSDASYQIQFITRWPGESEDRVTTLRLSPIAVNLLIHSLDIMMHDRDRWKIPTEPHKER